MCWYSCSSFHAWWFGLIMVFFEKIMGITQDRSAHIYMYKPVHGNKKHTKAWFFLSELWWSLDFWKDHGKSFGHAWKTKEKVDERNNDDNFSLSSGANNCKGKIGEGEREIPNPMRRNCDKRVAACTQPCSHAPSSLHQSASHAVHTHAIFQQDPSPKQIRKREGRR